MFRELGLLEIMAKGKCTHSGNGTYDSVGAYSKKNGVSDEDENIPSYICTLKEADTNCNTLLRGGLSVGMLRPKEL